MNFSHFNVFHREDGGDDQRLECNWRAAGIARARMCEVKTVKWNEIKKKLVSLISNRFAQHLCKS